jgi:hypothetical protein
MLLFDVFWRMCGENSYNVLMLLLFILVWIPISATLCMRAVLMLWHAFMFLGLRHVGFFPSFILFAWWFSLPFLPRTLFGTGSSIMKAFLRDHGYGDPQN